jgi:hypothetical protein
VNGDLQHEDDWLTSSRGRATRPTPDRTPVQSVATPATATHDGLVLGLQHRVGNAAVNRLLASGPQMSSPVAALGAGVAPFAAHVGPGPQPPVAAPTPLAAPVRPATPDEQREHLLDTAHFWEGSASYFSAPEVKLPADRFERVINTWYGMIVEAERTVATRFGGDAALRDQLRAAYTQAIRALMARASASLNTPLDELYRLNSGRIPMWAWQLPHHVEAGITTPIEQGRAAGAAGEVSFELNGFAVTIAPDVENARTRRPDRAETNIELLWRTPGFSFEVHGGQRIVTRFRPPDLPTVRIHTAYPRGLRAGQRSGYGRGTTPQDLAGARVTPASGSLGFHESNHGLDYIEFLRTNPAPRFEGTVGMRQAEFLAARERWTAALRQYQAALRRQSEARTDRPPGGILPPP